MANEQIRHDDDSIFLEIIKRATTDREFRNRVLTEPAAVIEEVIGVPMDTLPRPINVKFIEKEPGFDAVIVLPDFIDAEAALSDAELEAVAGGVYQADAAADGCTVTCVCTSCCLTEM